MFAPKLPYIGDSNQSIACADNASNVEQLGRWLDSMRHASQAACLNFLHLLRVDWYAGFRCSCPGGSTEYTADGIVMGIQLKQLCLQHPYRPAADAPLTAGNTLNSRCLLKSADRKPLVLLCSATGLPAASLVQLRINLAKGRGACLLPFMQTTEAVRLSDGSPSPSDEQRALPSLRNILACLATTAPADNLLPKALWPPIEKLIAGQQLSAAEAIGLQLSAVLHAFLQPPLHSGRLPAAITGFLTALLRVQLLLSPLGDC